jgi:hypothetical protein
MKRLIVLLNAIGCERRRNRFFHYEVVHLCLTGERITDCFLRRQFLSSMRFRKWFKTPLPTPAITHHGVAAHVQRFHQGHIISLDPRQWAEDQERLPFFILAPIGNPQ